MGDTAWWAMAATLALGAFQLLLTFTVWRSLERDYHALLPHIRRIGGDHG